MGCKWGDLSGITGTGNHHGRRPNGRGQVRQTGIVANKYRAASDDLSDNGQIAGA